MSAIKPMRTNGNHDPDLEIIPEGEDGARAQLHRLLTSGDWWLLPIVGQLSAAVGHTLVQTLISGRFDDAMPAAEGDVRELHTPDPLLRVLVVRRAVLPAGALAHLAALVAGRPEMSEKLLSVLDPTKLVVLGTEAERVEAVAQTDRLLRWINEGGPFPREEAP